jgi:hypothetical protein
MMYLGDYAEDEPVYFLWSTNNASGASITRATNGTVSVYKDNGTTQTTTGVTDTEDFDSLTGVHACTIVTTDAFYVTGADYAVVLSAATIDGQTVNAVLAHFSIQNRYMRGTDSGATAANLATLTGYVDTEVAAIKAKTDNLPASPAASGDVPSAAAIADQVWDEALAGHTGAGSTGAKLAASAGVSDLPGEPPAASAVADAVWDELLSGHTTAGSAGEYLAGAGGGSSPSSIADAVWDEALAGHSSAGSAGSALSAAGAAGIAAGAVEFTYTVKDSGDDPIDGAEVWITTDSGGTNVVWYGTTDAFGVARAADNSKPMLDVGTYYAWTKKAGFSFTNPDTLTVTAP